MNKKEKKFHLDKYWKSGDWSVEQVKFKSEWPLQSQTSSYRYVVNKFGSHFGLHQKAQGNGACTNFLSLKRNQSTQVMCKRKWGMYNFPFTRKKSKCTSNVQVWDERKSNDFFNLDQELMKRIKPPKGERNKRVGGSCWSFSLFSG
jgi:hypothetical protein